jgi:hypothetical protein
MNEEVKEYKEFIDGLVDFKGGAFYIIEQVRQGNLEQLSNRANLAQLVSKLPVENRQIFSEILQEIASASIQGVLAYIYDGDYRISKNGIEIMLDPLGNPPYYDYVGRYEGSAWEDLEWNDAI